MKNKPIDPWGSIDPPSDDSNMSALRVDPSLSWNIFWAVDVNKHCLLVLEHSEGSVVANQLPNIYGLDIEYYFHDDASYGRLIIRLIEKEHRSIFYQLCLNIIEATKAAKTEDQALKYFLGRVWRWHKLLRDGSDDKLSDEQQKGLMGELLVLETYLLPNLDAKTAMECWVGPFGFPKDFDIGNTAIEVKAKRSTRGESVRISSEDQLDTTGYDVLFLYIVDIVRSIDQADQAVSITDVAGRIRDIVSIQSIEAVDMFDIRLESVGFDWAHDYSEKVWVIGDEYLYDVCEGFPRLTPNTVPDGISGLSYLISLQECETFRISLNRIFELFSGGKNVR